VTEEKRGKKKKRKKEDKPKRRNNRTTPWPLAAAVIPHIEGKEGGRKKGPRKINGSFPSSPYSALRENKRKGWGRGKQKNLGMTSRTAKP